MSHKVSKYVAEQFNKTVAGVPNAKPSFGHVLKVITGADTSGSLEPVALATNTRKLYRAWLRESSPSCQMYTLDMPISEFKAKVREQFDKQSHQTDARIINALLIKGAMELQETEACFKTKSHVMRYWNTDPNLATDDFLTNFYKGKVC